MIKVVLFIIASLTSSVVFAAGDGVPMGTVISQLANLSLLVGGLYFSQRKTIAKAFKEKKENFLASVEAASQSQKEAENKLNEVSERLNQMQATFKKQIEEAKKNAEEAYRMQVSDARNNAEKVKSSALNNIEFEIQKQVENLRVETFQKSAEQAEEKLEKSLTPEQLKAWHSHFTDAKGAH